MDNLEDATHKLKEEKSESADWNAKIRNAWKV